MSFIYPYNIGSESAKMLAEQLKLKRIRGDKYIGPSCRSVINWGNSDFVYRSEDAPYINNPKAVAIAIDKLQTFIHLSRAGVNTPAFTVDEQVAKGWVASGSVVYGRRSLTSSQGKGIVILSGDSTWVSCPLYTKAIIKPHEYRVHVMGGRVIDFTKKRRRSDIDTNDYVRNSSGGWVFCRQDVILPDVVASVSVKAVASLGLDFGALDIAYSKDKAYVFEINTAPGLEGTTLQKYVENLRRYL